MEDVMTTVRRVVNEHVIDGHRGSNSRLDPALIAALQSAGYMAMKHPLPGPITLGRAPENDADLRTPLSRAIADIGIWRDSKLVGIIECEHDLNWVVPRGGKTPGSSAAPRYTMSSIARGANGDPFASYSSLERMAYIANWKGSASETFAVLDRICSDDPLAHNPSNLTLVLVTERNDAKGEILTPRLRSLGASLLCVER